MADLHQEFEPSDPLKREDKKRLQVPSPARWVPLQGLKGGHKSLVLLPRRRRGQTHLFGGGRREVSPEIASARRRGSQEFVDEGLLEHHVAEIGHVKSLEPGAMPEHKVSQLRHYHTLS